MGFNSELARTQRAYSTPERPSHSSSASLLALRASFISTFMDMAKIAARIDNTSSEIITMTSAMPPSECAEVQRGVRNGTDSSMSEGERPNPWTRGA